MTQRAFDGVKMLRRVARVLLVAGAGQLSASLSVGCSDPTDDASSIGGAVSEETAAAVVDLHLLDVWAQPLEDRSVTVTRNGRPFTHVEAISPETLRFLLGDEPGDYRVSITSPDHVPLTLTIAYDGKDVAARDASTGDDGGRAGLSVAHGSKSLRRRALPGHDVFVGLRHEWFSAQGRPARRHNAVRLLMNGEEAWRDFHDRAKQARSSILLSTWWWDSTFELVRDDPFSPPDVREANTILSVLEASPAEKRVLIGQFLGSSSLTSWMSSDARLRRHVSDPRFLFMREGNDSRGRFRFEVPAVKFSERVKESASYDPSARFDEDVPIPSTAPGHDVDITSLVDIASVHQKFAVVDGATAYIGGLNLRAVDWDTSEHKVLDPRRMEFDATHAERYAATLPCANCGSKDPGPRRDYMLRIDGPAVADAVDVFKRRWNHLVESGAEDSKGRPLLRPAAGDRGEKGRVAVQVTATMPGPYHEYAVAETWFNAVRKAERYIFIEDQFFRMPMMHDALVKRMDERPELKLVVITHPSSAVDPGCNQTRLAYQLFSRRYPERFLYLTMMAYDGALEPKDAYAQIFVHSKMLIIDDVFMSVGSANKNNRGLVYEHELNAAVLDHGFVSASLRRILSNLAPGVPDTDDPSAWFSYLGDVARENARRKQANDAPQAGFLYPLSVPSSCLLPTVGPDTA